MGNARPNGPYRFDDDDDFAASFVLSPHDVDAALAAETQEPAVHSSAPTPRIPAYVRKGLVSAAGAAVVLVVAALWRLAA